MVSLTRDAVLEMFFAKCFIPMSHSEQSLTDYVVICCEKRAAHMAAGAWHNNQRVRRGAPGGCLEQNIQNHLL